MSDVNVYRSITNLLNVPLTRYEMENYDGTERLSIARATMKAIIRATESSLVFRRSDGGSLHDWFVDNRPAAFSVQNPYGTA